MRGSYVASIFGRSAMLAPLAGAIVVLAQANGAAGEPTARAATNLQATDTAHLRYVAHGSSGSTLVEEGSASGTIPGSMRAVCNVGATLSATFTIDTRYGKIIGHGTATPHGSGTYESFAGTLVASGGTGRYAHAHGHAGLYGVIDRRTLSMTVQTTGTLSY